MHKSDARLAAAKRDQHLLAAAECSQFRHGQSAAAQVSHPPIPSAARADHVLTPTWVNAAQLHAMCGGSARAQDQVPQQLSSQPWGRARCTRQRVPATSATPSRQRPTHVRHGDGVASACSCALTKACHSLCTHKGLQRSWCSCTWYCCAPSGKGAGAGAASKPPAGAPQSAPSAVCGGAAASKLAAGVPSHCAAAASALQQVHVSGEASMKKVPEESFLMNHAVPVHVQQCQHLIIVGRHVLASGAAPGTDSTAVAL